MKFTAGALCLACDANYRKNGFLIPKDGDKTGKKWTMKVNKNSCVRLKTVCFDYLQEKTNVGQYVREAADQDKKRREFSGMKDSIEAMAKCMDEEDGGCSAEKKNEFITKASKVQETEDKGDTDKKKQEDMQAKFAGGKDKAPVSVKLPDGCTNKDDCDWICTHMAKANGGANFNAVDMRD